MLRVISLCLFTTATGLAAPTRGVEFKIAIVPLVDTAAAVTCTLSSDQLKIECGDKVLVQKVEGPDLARLRQPLAAVKPKEWDGFYATPEVLDGSLVAFSASNAQGEIGFQGANGCPAGFADLLETINAVVGEAVFDIEFWRGNAVACRRFEDKGDLVANLESMVELAAWRRGTTDSKP